MNSRRRRFVLLFLLIALFITQLMVDAIDDAPVETVEEPTEKSGATLVSNITSDDLLNTRGSYKKISPGAPTIVYLGIYVNNIDDINEALMEYTIDVYLREKWKDPRLAFAADAGNAKLKAEFGAWDKIWVPDIFFRNVKRSNFHHVTIPNRLLWIHSDGTIKYVLRLRLTLSCDMRLERFPMDEQLCVMQLESFAHTTDSLVFKWRTDPVQFGTFSMPQFNYTDITLKSCEQEYAEGLFPCLQVSFYLRRNVGYYLIQVYLPTALVVVLSWVSFMISVEAVPARVSIGVVTVLTITTQSSNARSTLPRVSYVKAIDIWLTTCLLFVFGSLLEFAIVNVVSRRDRTATVKRMICQTDIENGDMEAEAMDDHWCEQEPLNIQTKANGKGESIQLMVKKRATNKSPTSPRPQNLLQDKTVGGAANMVPPPPRGGGTMPPTAEDLELLRPLKNAGAYIDRVSLALFPLTFFLFNSVYWPYYTLSNNNCGQSSGGPKTLLGQWHHLTHIMLFLQSVYLHSQNG